MPYLLLCNNRLLMNNSGKLLLRDTVPETEEDCPCYTSHESYVWDVIFSFDSGDLDPQYEMTPCLNNYVFAIGLYPQIVSGDTGISADTTTIELIDRNYNNCYIIDNITKETIPFEPTGATQSYTALLDRGSHMMIHPMSLFYSQGGGYVADIDYVNDYSPFSVQFHCRLTFSAPVSYEALNENFGFWQYNDFSESPIFTQDPPRDIAAPNATASFRLIAVNSEQQ